jgi:hypothetical protein
MNQFRRCFVQWFLLLMTYMVMAFFAFKLHVFQFVWANDFTYISSIIAGIFVVMLLFIGKASWDVDSNPIKANALTVFVRSNAYIVTLLGLLGTAIGLMYQVENLSQINTADIANVVSFITKIGASIGTALLTTAAGIVAAIGMTYMNSNAEYFLDVKTGTVPEEVPNS